MKSEINTSMSQPTAPEATGETREAWQRPTLARLPLSETLLGGGSGADAGFVSPP